MLKGSATEVSRAYRLINTALDEVIAKCFKSYTLERLRELEELQNELQLTNQEQKVAQINQRYSGNFAL